MPRLAPKELDGVAALGDEATPGRESENTVSVWSGLETSEAADNGYGNWDDDEWEDEDHGPSMCCILFFEMIGVLGASAGYISNMARSPKQYPVSLCVTFMLVWGAVATLLVALASERYTQGAVDASRERLAGIRAEQVGAEVAQAFAPALAVYDALEYVIQRKLYYEPLDYDTIKGALAPLFAASEALRAVDVAFTDRNFSLTLRRRLLPPEEAANYSEPIVRLQSNAVDCLARLGARGCLRAQAPLKQKWYADGSALPGGQEDAVGRYAPLSRAEVGSAFGWLTAPRFVPKDIATSLGTGGSMGQDGLMKTAKVSWRPSYSLVFRSAFPGTAAALSLVGRAVVELGPVRELAKLSDEAWLGLQGGVFVCDREGHLLGAHEAAVQLAVPQPTGRPRFRKVWELDRAWARQLQETWRPDEPTQRVDIGEFHVSTAPLPGRGLGGHFRVLVAAERTAFRDAEMDGLLEQAVTAVVLPGPVAVCLFVVWWLLWMQQLSAMDGRPSSRESGGTTASSASTMSTY